MGFDPHLLPTLMQDSGLIEDLCRYSDNILSEKQVRQKWHLADDLIWHAMGTDEAFVEKVELERVRRIRNGATKRELAQLHIVKGPAVLDNIISDPKANPRHKVDAIKALDQLAGFAPVTTAEQDRIFIKIDLGADLRAKGLPSDPKDVLIVDVPVTPKPNPSPDTIDVTPIPNNTIDTTPDDPIPVQRKRGRPKGSKNKPKQLEPPTPSQENDSWKT
jgi:hypothetical protein